MDKFVAVPLLKRERPVARYIHCTDLSAQKEGWLTAVVTMAFPSGQPVASSVLFQCQLQRWKSLQLDMKPSPVLCCAEPQIYYRLDVWTGRLTRPGISVWTCSASATLSAGSGGRSAVCKSYQKTLWCLHPVERSRESVHNGTQREEKTFLQFIISHRFLKLINLRLSFTWTGGKKKKRFTIRDALSYSWTKHNLALLEQENLITCSAHWWGKHRKYTGEIGFNSATGKHW